MDTNEVIDDPLQILRYWWMLELFSPQKVPKLTGRSIRPEDRQVIEWRPGDALPWEVLRPPRPLGKTRRVWQHTVYLGVYDLEATYQYLHQAFGDDRDAYDERRAGLSACAGVLLDRHGVLMADSAVLSSALWAVARIGAGTARHDAWASGFPLATRAFAEQLDAFDGDRREAIGAQIPPAQDGASLLRLLQIAHQVSGISGVDQLASQRIVIASVAVSERRGEDLGGDIDFLNSFFLDDLAAVRRDLADGIWPAALARYLSGSDSADSDAIDSGGRTDVMTEPAVVDAGVAIARLPKGRWPSPPEHPLALRQQFAVNQALDDLAGARGLMGVNGPPGTGKTTMLRDILAGNVVERARALADLSRPEDAFTQTTHQWTAADGYPRKVRQLREELTGFEMVVASANNAAVENVTTEIPVREAIAEDWRSTADYFADIASATLVIDDSDDSEEDSPDTQLRMSRAWGVIAARLGNKGNRAAFRSEFWFDKTDPRTKQRVPGSSPRMQTRLVEWRDGTAPHVSWDVARARFAQAEHRVDELIGMRVAAQARLERLPSVLSEETRLASQTHQLRAAEAHAAEVVRVHARDLERVESEHEEALTHRERHIEIRPGVLETLFTLGRAAREWRTSLEPLDEQLRRAQRRSVELRSEAERLEQRVQDLGAEAERVEDAWARTGQELVQLRRQVAADHGEFQPGYPDDSWTDAARELRAPWLDAQLDAARSELFLAALQLHEDFLANAATDMLAGLRAAIEVVAGNYPRRLEPEKLRAAWQLFFLVVPLVSTTFASFGRMFAGLGRESLGWILIDEAGQACPQYAAGAIWRAQRVVVIGDPLQLQPIVTIPQKAQRDIAAAYRVSPTWIPPRASVQTLADRVARYGTTLPQGAESVWVSAPLTVHRRCDDPMFSLCNQIAYNGIMVSGVHRRLDDPDRPDAFDGPDGPLIAPSQWLEEPAMTTGTHLQPNQISRLRQELDRLLQSGIAASQIIAISPFRSVADKLSALTREYADLAAGTIHTAQGREADVVFLVLGGDPKSPGAKAWAASTVNLVNVAASRAKRRLYVIGDRAAWARHNYFHELSAVLRPV
ncbi:MAG: AAA domain-containing protein [Microlunatus sp.]